MPKNKTTIYTCSNCDSQFPKWLGRCPECGSWGTLEMKTASKDERKAISGEAGEILDFEEIKVENYKRFETGIEEFDRVLGGGIVPGSLILIGGEPGIGKSTLVLQIATSLKLQKPVLYISGEESAEQIKMRLDRLNLKSRDLKYLSETNIENIVATIDKFKPGLAIVDSIQTMYFSSLPSEAGSVAQVRVCTVKLLEICKKLQIPIFIIGHVTKEGLVAGPKTMEHLVDTVLYLEGDQYHAFRILRASKNRFGSTNEVGVFDMHEKGLVEVKNPSEVFLSERQKKPGSCVCAVMEGSRAFLVEIQALVNMTYYGLPRRNVSGIDFNRLLMLTAVLSKRGGLKLGNQDIYVNVVGGVKVSEPACDLAVCLAIASAYKNKPIDFSIVAIGEVGLGGEIRSVGQLEKRLSEAEKMGFKEMVMNDRAVAKKGKLNIFKVDNIAEAINEIFG